MKEALQELKSNSILIEAGTKVIWPHQGNRIGALDMSEAIGEFSGRSVYATNNSTIAYICDSQFFVTPYTHEAEETLEDAGFTKEWFYVPCSNGDLPFEQADKWAKLRAAAQKSYEQAFEKECRAYCADHHIREISDRALSKCLQVPEKGMRIQVNGIESTYYPALQSVGILNETGREKLGHYCTNKVLVAFVYLDGKTYLARGSWILNELNLAGFLTCKNIYAPTLRDGRGILDPELKAKFDSLPRFI